MVAAVTAPDLGALRGLSKDTLALFNVRNNGTGWEWDTKCMDGAIGTRWKSYSSTRPEGDDHWAKYRWKGEKPALARYFVPVKGSLTRAIQDAFGTLYLVGGEIAAMSMIEAGYPNTTCTFGDNNIPDSLLQDLKAWGVSVLTLIPDRDKSGEGWASKIRQMLLEDFEIEVVTVALPYPLTDKHGKDVNDFWLDIGCDKAAFRDRLKQLDAWKLPEIAPKPLSIAAETDKDIPESLKADIRQRLGVHEEYNAEGWSRRNVRCPFHDDRVASATWNDQKSILHCHGTCGRDYLAKDLAEYFGLRMGDYYRSEPIPIARTEVVKDAPEKPAAKTRYSPKLPAFAQLSPEQAEEAQLGRDWLDYYLGWTHKACPLAPEIFHEAMALWLLATVSTRRMKLVLGGQEIFPNLYVMIVAKTSLYRKSTAMNLAKKLLKEAGLECLLLPTDVTPEALFDELAGVKPANFDNLSIEDRHDWLLGRSVAAQRSFLKDECSSIFASLRKEYNAGLTELLLEGYQGDGGKLKKLLKGRGLISVKDMCLSFLGATTPVMFAKYIGNDEAENGFTARFAIITPEGIPAYEISDEPVPVPPLLVKRLRQLFLDVLPWHGGNRPSASASIITEVVTPPVAQLTIAPEAIAQLSEYRKALNYDMLVNETVDEGKAAAYTRLGTMVVKVSMLLAAIDTETAPIRIEAAHAYAAQQICERWRESLHRLDRDIARSNESANEKVLNYLKTCGESGATLRDIMRDCGIKAKNYVEDVLKVLIEDTAVEKYERKPEGAGRPSVRFRVLSSSRN